MTKRRRCIVEVPGLWSMSRAEAEGIRAQLMDWYENGSDPLVIPTGCKVYGFTDEWEHTVDVSTRKSAAISECLREHEATGWQLCGTTESEGGNVFLIFKRPRGLDVE